MTWYSVRRPGYVPSVMVLNVISNLQIFNSRGMAVREISWREFEKSKGSVVDVENFEIRYITQIDSMISLHCS
jgi:hypothetical protein